MSQSTKNIKLQEKYERKTSDLKNQHRKKKQNKKQKEQNSE